MKLDFETANELSQQYGDAFYILDTVKFKNNFKALTKAFRDIYPNMNIAYSYKTNYIPRLCKAVDELGGYAEVVSDMEYELALRVGVSPEKIMFNGPYKDPAAVEKLLLSGGTVNLDNIEEIKIISEIMKKHPAAKLSLGIRCNFDIGDGVISRFGFDINGGDFAEAVGFINANDNLLLTGIHCHFASRALDYWPNRAETAISLYDRLNGGAIGHIDLGGGIYGKMSDSLKAQFSGTIPEFTDYARAVATVFAERFPNGGDRPVLFVEPGTALAGDAMRFAARVTNIKSVSGKPIATLLGSMYNINPTLNKKNPPLEILHGGNKPEEYKALDFAGFTCIESDYLYRGYNGRLAVGDFAVFDNVGSYSVVLKPPFILPNFAVLDLDAPENRRVVKRRENFDDIFHTYDF